ncbi:MAG: response regulator, partial [Clostridiales bacterium]|nr:response regulator [Clostridiales bacterium]
MGLNILIADDEELIRKGLIARLDYLGYQFDSLLEADDGLMAIELLEKHKIDVMITDIRMINMDGLKLIHETKEKYPWIQFVILSGYAEFSYAEEAIKLGVTSYLLKPVSNDELKKAMDRILEYLEKVQSENSIISQSEKTIAENETLWMERKVNEMLSCEDREQARTIFQTLTIGEKFSQKTVMMLALISIDLENYERRKLEYKDTDLIRFVIKNIFDEISLNKQRFMVNNITDSNQLFVILIEENKELLRQEAEQLFAVLHNSLWKNIGISITIGVSSVDKGLCAENLRQANEAFLQRVIHGSGNLYFYDDIKILTAEKFPNSELQMLRQYIDRHDVGNIEFMINEILSDERVSQYNANYIRVMWMRILNILLKSSGSETDQSAMHLGRMIYHFEKMAQGCSLTEIREYLYHMIIKGIETQGSTDVNTKNKIKRAIHYIEEHYNEDIAINDMAEKFFM